MTIVPAIKKHLTWFTLLSLFFAAMLLMACEKEDTTAFVNAAKLASEHLSTDLDATYYFSVFHRAIYDTALINNDTAIIDSAMVYRSYDSLSGITSYLFDYGQGTLCEDFKIKSGTIEALLDQDFAAQDAMFTATFTNFKIDDASLIGTAVYRNSGEMEAGKMKFLYTADFNYSNQNSSLQYQSDKIMVWSEGSENPNKIENQRFAVQGTSFSAYNNPNNTAIPEAKISGQIDGEWNVALRCPKLIQQGNVKIEVMHQNVTDTMNGNFIDSDLDGCGDKIMLKNKDNFGYPVYI